MQCTTQVLTDCPLCGDEVYVFRTYQKKRFAKCIDEKCTFSFGLPQKGSLEPTGMQCPEHDVQVIAVVPNMRLSRGRFRKQEGQTYFWASKPCFACNLRSTCVVLQELKEEYLDEN